MVLRCCPFVQQSRKTLPWLLKRCGQVKKSSGICCTTSTPCYGLCASGMVSFPPTSICIFQPPHHSIPLVQRSPLPPLQPARSPAFLPEFLVSKGCPLVAHRVLARLEVGPNTCRWPIVSHHLLLNMYYAMHVAPLCSTSSPSRKPWAMWGRS